MGVFGDAEFTGAFNYLSGAFDTLSGQVTDNIKLLLGLPNKTDFDNMQAAHSQQFNSITSDIADLESKFNDLYQLAVNLKLSHSALTDDFTGHTGQAVFDFSGNSVTGAHGDGAS